MQWGAFTYAVGNTGSQKMKFFVLNNNDDQMQIIDNMRTNSGELMTSIDISKSNKNTVLIRAFKERRIIRKL